MNKKWACAIARHHRLGFPPGFSPSRLVLASRFMAERGVGLEKGTGRSRPNWIVLFPFGVPAGRRDQSLHPPTTLKEIPSE